MMQPDAKSPCPTGSTPDPIVTGSKTADDYQDEKRDWPTVSASPIDARLFHQLDFETDISIPIRNFADFAIGQRLRHGRHDVVLTFAVTKRLELRVDIDVCLACKVGHIFCDMQPVGTVTGHALFGRSRGVLRQGDLNPVS